ncbi:MAG TPA: monooxygenase [Chloroflexota bacterium]|nr:monooxygenase [Chloroflexota bacterium]
MAQSKTFAGKRAVVIGASMGGLLAARVLADHFEQVTLLERDTFPTGGENRKGVPQGRHAHAVLAQGLQIMEGYFPGLTERLISLGADYGDVSYLVRWFHEGGCHQPTMSGVNAINISRPRLEAEVRARVLALPNVQAVEGCDVLGLLATPDNGRISGVRIIRRKAGSAEESLNADLVVDASGRGSRSPAWLEELGYERPSEEAVKVGVTYTSCQYRRKPEHIPGVNALVMAASPENPRVGVLLSQEGGRWMLTVAGYLGGQAKPDQASLLEFVRCLPNPAIYQVIKDAEPIGEPATHKIPSNLRRRYEQLTRFPQGYLVMGDALASFNPVYAQGMSVAAMEAAALDGCLAQGEARLAERFFKQAGKIIDIPWSTAVGNDLRFPEVEGPRNGMVRFINWYISKLHHAAQHDAVVSVAFLKVVNLVEPPPSVMHPRIMWRVLRGNLGARAGRQTAQPESLVVGEHSLTG